MCTGACPAVNRGGAVNEGRIDLRTYVALPVWYGCNNNCTMCMLSGLKQSLPGMAFDNYQRLIHDIVSDGTYRNLILSGAEVTTFDGLERYLHHAAVTGWFTKIQIQTNGRRLCDNAYCRRLVACGLNEAFISIHGRENVHDAITNVPGSFRQTLEGIRNMQELGVNVITNTVLTRMNYHEVLPLFADLCRESIHELNLWNYYPMDATDTRNLLVSMEDFTLLLPGLGSFFASPVEGPSGPEPSIEQSVIEQSVIEQPVDEQPNGPILVLKHFPQCLAPGGAVCCDNWSPRLIMHEHFWEAFSRNEFGLCPHRQACTASACWGLSRAHINKYGDEGELLAPITVEAQDAGTFDGSGASLCRRPPAAKEQE